MTPKQVYSRLFKHYGEQNWWPARSRFEVMVGAILTQNTAWTNVEKAIALLRQHHCLSARAITDLPMAELANRLRSSGYFNLKARRLKNFCAWYLAQGEYRKLRTWPTATLRHALLSINGIGPETADDILLYAFDRPVFVVDAYTRRLFSRLGLVRGDESYEELRHGVERSMQADEALYNEYHALIVRHAKHICRKQPVCHDCLFNDRCPTVHS